jgi:predicted phage baseplate assembly protein
VPRNQHWSVHGVSGVFGLNLDAMAGGADALGFDELRREARRRVRTERALVTRQDVIDAALALPDLQVARAEVFIENRVAGRSTVLPGTLTLVVLRASVSVPGGNAHIESPRWLEAVRTHLAERLPLGERLRVIAPRYVRVRVEARLVAAPMEDPARIASAAGELLRLRLALTAQRPGAAVWPFGAPLSVIQVAAWLRKLPGVERVAECRLYQGDADAPVQKVVLPRIGLPAFDLAASNIRVQRRGAEKKT